MPAACSGPGGGLRWYISAPATGKEIKERRQRAHLAVVLIYLQTVPGVTLKEAKSPLDLDPTLG